MPYDNLTSIKQKARKNSRKIIKFHTLEKTHHKVWSARAILELLLSCDLSDVKEQKLQLLLQSRYVLADLLKDIEELLPNL